MIGEQMKRFMQEVLELGDRTGEFKVHFASAREAFNMVAAAVDGKQGEPGSYRDYKLRQIMHEGLTEGTDEKVEVESALALVDRLFEMRNEIQITGHEATNFLHSSEHDLQVKEAFAQLDRDGLVVLPDLLSPVTLRAMQQAFAARLQRLRWNNFEGYQKTEPYRHMVEDVLILDQGFVDLVLHPLVKGVLESLSRS
jgi:hypothetical protein